MSLRGLRLGVAKQGQTEPLGGPHGRPEAACRCQFPHLIQIGSLYPLDQ